MKRKLGPLKLWQWIAIGVALGVGVYLLRGREGTGEVPAESFGSTGTGAFGPIDPETGIPYAFQNAPGNASTTPADPLASFLDTFGALREAGAFETPQPEVVTEYVEAPGPGQDWLEELQQRNANLRGALKKARAKNSARSTGSAAHQGQNHKATQHPKDRLPKQLAARARTESTRAKKLRSEGKTNAARKAAQRAKRLSAKAKAKRKAKA